MCNLTAFVGTFEYAVIMHQSVPLHYFLINKHFWAYRTWSLCFWFIMNIFDVSFEIRPMFKRLVTIMTWMHILNGDFIPTRMRLFLVLFTKMFRYKCCIAVIKGALHSFRLVPRSTPVWATLVFKRFSTYLTWEVLWSVCLTFIWCDLEDFEVVVSWNRCREKAFHASRQTVIGITSLVVASETNVNICLLIMYLTQFL